MVSLRRTPVTNSPLLGDKFRCDTCVWSRSNHFGKAEANKYSKRGQTGRWTLPVLSSHSRPPVVPEVRVILGTPVSRPKLDRDSYTGTGVCRQSDVRPHHHLLRRDTVYDSVPKQVRVASLGVRWIPRFRSSLPRP